MPLPRFDFVDLELFVAVAEARSITRGAERVHLAVASASERIKKLEGSLGVALLRRVRRGVELTAAGATMLDHARVVLQDVRVMQGDLAAYAKDIRTSIRLLANTAAYAEHLPNALAAFLASHPNIAVEVEERESPDIAQALASGVADLGIVVSSALPDNIARYPFCDDRLVVVVPAASALAVRRDIAFHTIAGLPFVGLSQSSALQGHIAGHAARLGIRMNIRARVNDFDTIGRMVEAGAGIAIIPEASARRCRQRMKIKLLRLTDEWALRTLVICARDFRSLPASSRRLVDHLRNSSAKIG